MIKFTVQQIGVIENDGRNPKIILDKEYKEGLLELEGFGQLMVVWYADRYKNDCEKQPMIIEKPYVKGPEKIGLFATRSACRPNVIAVSITNIKSIDRENGVIHLYYIDAMDKTPLLDIKPYTPSSDRIEHPKVPTWCAHWPKCYEEGAMFDWASEFNF